MFATGTGLAVAIGCATGHNNPSIVSSGGMESEGVGSYWPFATGKRVPSSQYDAQTNNWYTTYHFHLVPKSKHWVWQVGFKPQLLMREYLTRRGAAQLKTDQYQAARCPLLELWVKLPYAGRFKNSFAIFESVQSTWSWFRRVTMPAPKCFVIFQNRITKIPEGRLITYRQTDNWCLFVKCKHWEYNEIIPMSYQYEYSFNKIEDYEQSGDNNGF